MQKFMYTRKRSVHTWESIFLAFFFFLASVHVFGECLTFVCNLQEEILDLQPSGLEKRNKVGREDVGTKPRVDYIQKENIQTLGGLQLLKLTVCVPSVRHGFRTSIISHRFVSSFPLSKSHLLFDTFSSEGQDGSASTAVAGPPA